MEVSYFEDAFLLKSVLGRDALRQDDPDDGHVERVRLYCIRKAYDDMMSAGRYYQIKDKAKKCEVVLDCFEKHFKEHEYCFSQRLIQDVAEHVFSEACIGAQSSQIAFGLAQKIVNMTFKYFYCFRDFIGWNIDFETCDCPIDRNVLDQMVKDDLLDKKERNAYTWSKLSPAQYIDLQEKINEAGLTAEETEGVKDCSKRLLYDFVRAW